LQEGDHLVGIKVTLSDIGVPFGEDAELARSKAALDVNAGLSQGLLYLLGRSLAHDVK
jgi:hypothetical protein